MLLVTWRKNAYTCVGSAWFKQSNCLNIKRVGNIVDKIFNSGSGSNIIQSTQLIWHTSLSIGFCNKE